MAFRAEHCAFQFHSSYKFLAYALERFRIGSKSLQISNWVKFPLTGSG